MSSVSPGGVHVSSAKKRRLAALDAASKSSAGTKKGLDKPVLTTALSKQQRHVSSRGQSGAAATAGLGKASQQEPQELQYATLAQSIAEGPVLKSVMPAGLKPPMSVDVLLENVLKTNPRATDARTTIASRVHNKVFLLENPTAALTTKSKHKKHNRRLSCQLLSCKKRPALGTNHKYSDFMPLHKLWRQYMEESLRLCQNREACILAADFHGCNLEVMHAANPIHVGLAGIVIKDTAAAFTILTQTDRTHHILKHASTFCFSIDDKTRVTMFGTSLQRERSKG